MSDSDVRSALTDEWATTVDIADRVPNDEGRALQTHVDQVRRTLASFARYGMAERRSERVDGRLVYEWRLPSAAPLTRAAAIRKTIADHGTLHRSRLLEAMGVPASRKGTAGAVRSALWREIRSGRVLLSEDGMLSLGTVRWEATCHGNGQIRTERTEGIIEEYLRQEGEADIVTICDDLDMSRGAVRSHLRRMGAVYRMDGKTRVWSLPGRGDDERGPPGPADRGADGRQGQAGVRAGRLRDHSPEPVRGPQVGGQGDGAGEKDERGERNGRGERIMMYLAIVDDEIWEDHMLVRTVSRRRHLEADTLEDLLVYLERWARLAYTRHAVEKVALEPGTGVREGSVDITAKLVRVRNGKDLYTWRRIGSLEEWGYGE